MIHHKKHSFWFKFIAVELICLVFFNNISWTYPQTYLALKTVLQVPVVIDTYEFKEKVEVKAFLLAHKAIKEYINKQVKKERNIFGREWEARRTKKLELGGHDKQISELDSIVRIKVAGLRAHTTGEFEYVELSDKNYNGVSVLYVDSGISGEFLDIVTKHKVDEIIQWENLRVNLLRLDRSKMRRWIKDHINTSDEYLKETIYEGLTSCQIAKLFHEKAFPLDPLYEKFARKESFVCSYINTMLSIYGPDEESGDVKLAEKVFDNESSAIQPGKPKEDVLPIDSKKHFQFWENVKLYGSTALIIGVLFILIHFFIPAISLNELLGLRNMPSYLRVLSYTNTKIITGYNVFLTGGELLAQIIRFRNNKKTQRDTEFQIDWKKIGAVFLLTNFLYCWFWPFTYVTWLKSIPSWILGLADQPFTGLISISAAFLVYSLVEFFWSGDERLREERTLRQIIRGKSSELVETLRCAFPYWVIALGIIFGAPKIGLSLSFSTQNMLVSFCEIPFAIYMFYMAGGKGTENQTLQTKPWTKYAVLPAIIYSFAFFAVNRYFIVSLYVVPWLPTVIGGLLYAGILYFGFKNQKDEVSPESEKKPERNFEKQRNELQKDRDNTANVANQITQEKKQEAVLESNIAFGDDIENALVIMSKLMPISFKKGEIYELRYNKMRFNEYSMKAGLLHKKNSPEALLQAYVNLLRIRAPDPGSIKVIPHGNENAPLIIVSRYVSKGAKTPIGEGSINIEGSLDGQLLQIVGMLNIVFAISHIPNNVSPDEMNEYNHLMGFIKNQYKKITGEELSLGDKSKVIRHIVLPKARVLPISSLEEYYRLTIQQLYRSA